MDVLRILHFGDSHAAAAGSTLSYSHFFQSLYGQGGPGLCLPWVTPRTGLSSRKSRGWQKSQSAHGDGLSGLSAGYLETRKAGESAEVEGSFSRFRLYLLKDPNAGKVSIRADGALLGEWDLAGAPGQLAVISKAFSPKTGSRKWEIRTIRDGLVRILGIAFEEGAGAVYSPLAFNGARADWMKGIPGDLFRSQLEAESPDLILFSFGTNEANAGDFNPEPYQKNLESILSRVQNAAPHAVMLLIGPPDGHLKQGGSATLASVISSQRAVAAAFGALFVDQRQAMGGAGSVDAWLRQGWANQDQVHMTTPGYEWLARNCVERFLESTGQQASLTAVNWGHSGTERVASKGQSAKGGGLLPKQSSEIRPIYTFRNKAGGLLLTDDLAKVPGEPGEWIRETSH
jgi:hypothetical protein